MGPTDRERSGTRPPAEAENPEASPRRSPFHAGERFIHARLGDAERTERRGQQMIRTEMPTQHREFFATLPFLVCGIADARGALWATLLTGSPGFVSSPTATTLRIERAIAPMTDQTATFSALAPLGLLGIELETRRRNRANGHVTEITERGVSVQVTQSFGNCPKYITGRTPGEQEWLARANHSTWTSEGARLSAQAMAVVQSADTCFVASASGDPRSSLLAAPGGIDVSHRGGPSGFLRLSEHRGATRITVPDYSGNQMFNTLGNLLVYQRAGLLLLEFSSQRLLSLSGRTEIEWEGPGVDAVPGAERLWHLDVESGWLSNALAS